jgi:UDP-glucose:(heptosyl)LPS alpha-1,3-glucosyltransferase
MRPTVTDLTPFLWSADVFAFPSHYETFAIVAYEAAAAGLPLLATPVHGVEDLLVDGENGWQIEPDGEVIATRLRQVIAQRDDLPGMGAAARQAALSFGPERFDRAWTAFYDERTPPTSTSEEMDHP